MAQNHFIKTIKMKNDLNGSEILMDVQKSLGSNIFKKK